MHEWGKWGRPFVEYGLAAARDALADAGLGWRDMQFVSGADTIRNGYPGFVVRRDVRPGARLDGRPGRRASTPPVPRARWPSPTPGPRSWPGCATWRWWSARTRRPKGFFAPVGGERKDDPDWLRFHLMGATNPTYFALYARRRMDRFGATEEDFAQVKVKNARHGLANPYARYRKEVTVDEVLASPMVADPLRLLEICATSDGGAALVLSSMEFARRHAGGATPLVTIDAVSTVTPTFPNTVIEMPNFSTDSAAASTGARRGGPAVGFRPSIATAAYAEAGIGPEDVSLAEVYDLSSALELDWYEDIGLCGEGEAEKLLRDGATALGRPGAGQPLGRPLLLRRGHPGPGHRPGVRVRLAAPGQRHRAPGGGGQGGRHGQPGPVRARVLGPPEPLKPQVAAGWPASSDAPCVIPGRWGMDWLTSNRELIAA